MNLFQWIILPLLGLLFLWEVRNALFRRPSLRMDRLIRCAVWAAAFVAVADPNLTVRVANFVGINRGTDLVLYAFVLAFLGTSFYFYSRTLRLERQVTDLVRHLAIAEARRGPAAVAGGE